MRHPVPLLALALLAGPMLPADDKKADPKKDEDAILGTWRVVKADTGLAVTPPADELENCRMTLGKGGKASVVGLGGHEKVGTYTLDPAAEPKALDLTFGDKEESRDIYELTGDTLTVAVAAIGTPRPTEFKATTRLTDVFARKFVIVLTFKRVKGEKKEDTKDEPKKDR